MIFKSLLIFLSLVSITKLSHAAILMNDSKMLDIVVSKKGMTRLSVVGDTIDDIVFPPVQGETSLSDIIHLQSNGHVFLLPKDEIKRPFQLTVFTRRGKVQDLTMIPSSRPPEPVLLKPALSIQEQEKILMIQKQIYEQTMKAILSGIIPSELRRIRPSSIQIKTWGNLKGMPVSSFEDKCAFYDVYSIENTSSNLLSLSASHFLFRDVEAALFERELLDPASKTTLILLRSKSDKKLLQPLKERT